MTAAENAFEASVYVLRRLKARGFETWLVGGGVRDHLLGMDPSAIDEWDVASAARPADVAASFPRTFEAGKAFGVTRVPVGSHAIEVATFRTEASYTDGRHPDVVRFATAEEDVGRRDFTVNGLLWDPDTGEVRDHVGGRADLEARVIRAIGDPEARFHEDGLRLLRAVRFGAWRDFRLDGETLAAVRHQRERLAAVAPERIREELVKIAVRPSSRRGDALRLLVATGLSGPILGVTMAGEGLEADADVLDALEHRDLSLFLAVTQRRSLPRGSTRVVWRTHAEGLAASLRCSREEAAHLVALLTDRSCYRGLEPGRTVRRRLASTREDRALHEDLLRAEGDAPDVLALLDETRSRFGPSLPAPLLDGRDLLRRGMRPGRGLGRALRRVRALQLRGTLSSAQDALRHLGLE